MIDYIIIDDEIFCIIIVWQLCISVIIIIGNWPMIVANDPLLMMTVLFSNDLEMIIEEMTQPS